MPIAGRTWSTGAEWAGFKPVEYSLDFQKIISLALVEVRRVNDVDEDIPTTIGEALQKLATSQIESADMDLDAVTGKMRHAVTIKTDAGDLKFRGAQFDCDVFAMLLNFRREGINPFDTAWLFYDQDSVTDDPHEMYSFFVAHGDKIIRERVSFSDHSGNGFDPTIFAVDDSEPIWLNESAWKDAQVRLWYRKFYSETLTGQLMVLRSDEPDLFHYPEGGRTAAIYAASDSSSEGRASVVAFPETASVQKWLEKIHFVLWVVAVLAIIQFLFRWL